MNRIFFAHALMRLLLIMFISVFTLSTNTVYGQNSTAQQTASSEKRNDYILGGASISAGTALMVWSCPYTAAMGGWGVCMAEISCAVFCYALGPGLVMEGTSDIMKAHGRSATIAPLTATPPPQGPPCELDPTNPLCSHSKERDLTGKNPTGNNPNGNPGGFTKNNPGGGPGGNDVPQIIAETLKNAQETANKFGVNTNDPASIRKNALDHGVNYDKAMEDLQSGDIQFPPNVQAAIDKAKNDFLNKMGSGASTSDVAFEGGSGGHRGSSRNGDNNGLSDLNSLLKNMQNGAGDRGPASTAGLQKNFNGDSIGVASDDIFKIVTRRYQKKIQDRTVGPLKK
jgi:hypothetical protein